MAGLCDFSLVFASAMVIQGSENLERGRLRKPNNCFEISDKKFVEIFRLKKIYG